MHALILAAGDGGRLQPLTDDTPKPLIEVAGRPLIAHVLEALCAAGVREATVVVGYRGDQVRAALAPLRTCGMKLCFVENADFMAGNARSLWAARDAAPDGFVLAMADHLIEPRLVTALVAGERGRCALAVDHAPPCDPRADEATHVRVDERRIVAIGKGVEPWDALDTGLFWCTRDVFDAMTPELRDGELSAVFASLAARGDLDAVDVTGMGWIDVDTAADLAQAERWFAAGEGFR